MQHYESDLFSGIFEVRESQASVHFCSLVSECTFAGNLFVFLLSLIKSQMQNDNGNWYMDVDASNFKEMDIEDIGLAKVDYNKKRVKVILSP